MRATGGRQRTVSVPGGRTCCLCWRLLLARLWGAGFLFRKLRDFPRTFFIIMATLLTLQNHCNYEITSGFMYAYCLKKTALCHWNLCASLEKSMVGKRHYGEGELSTVKLPHGRAGCVLPTVSLPCVPSFHCPFQGVCCTHVSYGTEALCVGQPPGVRTECVKQDHTAPSERTAAGQSFLCTACSVGPPSPVTSS